MTKSETTMSKFETTMTKNETRSMAKKHVNEQKSKRTLDRKVSGSILTRGAIVCP